MLSSSQGSLIHAYRLAPNHPFQVARRQDNRFFTQTKESNDALRSHSSWYGIHRLLRDRLVGISCLPVAENGTGEEAVKHSCLDTSSAEGCKTESRSKDFWEYCYAVIYPEPQNHVHDGSPRSLDVSKQTR